MDRIAWVEGVDAPLKTGFFGEIQTTLTVDEAISATGVDPDRVLNAIAVRAESAGEIDPRFSGIDAKIVWVVRVAGTTDEFGTADATNVVVDDSNSNVVLTLPLAVEDDYAPALLTVQVEDQRTPSGGDWGYTNYSIVNGGGRAIHGQEAGVALEPGTYTLRGNITGDITSPPPGPPCETQVELAASQDLWLKVTFAQDGSCAWAGTRPLP